MRSIINENNEAEFIMDILSKIIELRKERNWSEYRLSEEADLPQSTISSWYKKDMLPSITSLEKICGAFGITMSQFFANDSERVALTDDQKEMLKRWVTLNGAQKQALLDFFKGSIQS